jgi:hypothetical protein
MHATTGTHKNLRKRGESPTHGHGDSVTQRLTHEGSCQLTNLPMRGVEDSPTHRCGKFSLKIQNRLPELSIGGVDFLLRISPRIRSQNRNGSKVCERDLCLTDFCKNIGKYGWLPSLFLGLFQYKHVYCVPLLSPLCRIIYVYATMSATPSKKRTL